MTSTPEQNIGAFPAFPQESRDMCTAPAMATDNALKGLRE
jgi:hypothetical protein